MTQPSDNIFIEHCPSALPFINDAEGLKSEDAHLTRTKTWLLLAYGTATVIFGMALLFCLKYLVFSMTYDPEYPGFFHELFGYDGNSVREADTLFQIGLYTGIMVFTMYLTLLGFFTVRYLYQSGMESGKKHMT